MSSLDCPCVTTPFPKPWAIPAGLGEAFFRPARSLGFFPDWRVSILEAIGRRPALDGWRARDAHDLGLMLAEMGAYMADVVSFYDALAANETYLQTAALSGTRRELVGLLGYRPRPAIASEVLLAAQADGVKLVTLPAGTAFRSSQFLDGKQDKQAPQVFELGTTQVLDPRINRLAVERVRATAIDAPFDRLWVEPGSVRLKPGAAVVISFNGVLRTARIASVRPMPGLRRGVRAVELRFTQSITPPPGASYAGLRILASGISSLLWQGGKLGSDVTQAISGKDVLLGSQAALRAGEIVLFEKGDSLHASYADAVTSSPRVLLPSLTSQVKDKDDKKIGSLVSPDIKVAVTKVSLGSALSWSYADVNRITLYHTLSDAAKVMAPVKDTLAQGDPVSLPELIDPPRVAVNRVLLEDVHGEGVESKGSVSAASRSATLASSPVWGKTLTAPVNLLGNVLNVSRGETVKAELLGAGNASLAAQTFKLKKKPLTYLSAANAEGRASTLNVWVGGVLWREVPSFYGCKPDEEVFIVRHDDDGETYITFGGAARPPTGSAIFADYRFGGGASQPPAGAVNQLARPVAGLKRAHNVLPAFGGADAESPIELAATAPRSALLLGRAVSLLDLDAAAAAVPGVKAVRSAWRWDEAGLRPAAVIRFIGDGQLLPLIRARLRELSEPDAAISVERAQPQTASLSMQLLIDPSQEPSMAISRALEALYAPPDFSGTGGLLRAERLGPDGVLFLSHIVEAVMNIPGVTGVQSASFNHAPFNDIGYKPLAGRYWDFGEAGGVDFRINIDAGIMMQRVKSTRRVRL